MMIINFSNKFTNIFTLCDISCKKYSFIFYFNREGFLSSNICRDTVTIHCSFFIHFSLFPIHATIVPSASVVFLSSILCHNYYNIDIYSNTYETQYYIFHSIERR